jgi:uncharacterized membrane protein YgcG
MSQRLAEYEKETCHRINVLVLQTFEGNTLAEYSAQTMKERNIAPPPLESGLLMTVVIADGTARIDAGRGLQDIVNSGRADAILKTGAFPLFVEEKYEEGIVRALMLLMAEGRSIMYPDELRPEHCR